MVIDENLFDRDFQSRFMFYLLVYISSEETNKELGRLIDEMEQMVRWYLHCRR